jgi:hypothetical protein
MTSVAPPAAPVAQPQFAPAYGYPAAGPSPIAQVVWRADRLALSIGSRISISTLMLACVLVIVAGASSMLSSLHKMDDDLKVINVQLAETNVANDRLNQILASLAPMNQGLLRINHTMDGTIKAVSVSASALSALSGRTRHLNSSLAFIALQTDRMRHSLDHLNGQTTKLGTTVTALNGHLDPLVTTQHQTLLAARGLPNGIHGMMGSLAYVIRMLDYIGEPPTGAGLEMKVDIPKSSLPPVPGLKATADPVQVFPRDIWPQYTGP